MNEKNETISIRQLASSTTTKRILAGQRLGIRMGRKVIADIIPRPRTAKRSLDEILAPVKAAALKAAPGRNLILDDRERFRR